MTISIPNLKLRNPLNGNREHWAVKSRRVRGEHDRVWYGLLEHGPRRPVPPCRVTMTRVYTGQGKPMDGDGLQAAFKATRDTVAEYLRIDDAESTGMQWVPMQERGTTAGVIITIEEIERAVG